MCGGSSTFRGLADGPALGAGHPETKATCLWLQGLPRLTPTAVVEGREARVHREPPGPERWRNRSRTYPGIATAMAHQWGGSNGA